MDKPLLITAPRRTPQPPGWGAPMPLLHRSIADIPESELIEKVLRDWHYRQSLFNIKGLNFDDAQVLKEVELCRFRKDLAGDIDILVIPRSAPSESAAIQVKRFKAKVSLDDAHTGHPRRLEEVFAKGVHQANELARIGFSQVYLWVFVAIDTREQNLGRYCYDGPDSIPQPRRPGEPLRPSLRCRVDSAISAGSLAARVGLMKFEWTQPMDRAPLELGTYGGSLERLAVSGTQPVELSAWLQTLVDA
jgi:hypothetical protein